MEAKRIEDTQRDPGSRINWESFYANYRKPGYVPGFEIINKLGGGVFGMVFKARKESIGKDYAIKFLKVDDEGVRDAVVRELSTVRFFAQIDHPNLVSIEDKGEVDGIPFIIMSYAGEETLRQRLEPGALEREDALRVFIQAARGVQALHERSLVHFDLKPANIFLKGDIARVGDYGLSKLITESRNSLSFGRGTPYYMAPEMLQRKGDARSDIYSLGILLYECLVGDVPFKGDSEWEVLRKHEVEAPTYPPHVAESDRRVINRCLAKNADDRFQRTSDLLRALQAPAALGESLLIPPPMRAATPAPRPPLSPPPPPPVRPEPTPASSAGPSPSEPADRRDPKNSPYSMSWATERETGVGGVIGGTVHVMFRAFELIIMLVLLPVRVVSMGFGQGLVFLLQLPFKILAGLFRLAGFILMMAVVVAILMGVILLVTSLV